MAEISEPRRVARVSVTAYVTGADNITSEGGTRYERTWQPTSINAEYLWNGQEWFTTTARIRGAVLKKDGTPGQRDAQLWQPASFPQWAIDFIEANKPTGGQP